MITVVYGTRPEAIKLASVVRELRAHSANVHVICTGQHRELLDGVELKPDVSLGLMEPNQKPFDFIARVEWMLDLRGTRQLVVQGDTATAFAGALAAFHRSIPIAHVEAGLRTYRLDSPFPEEGYRQMIDRLASRMYAPTEVAASCIRQERSQGRSYHRLLVTGNTGIDAALSVPSKTTVMTGPFALVTVHRREAFGAPLNAIVRAIKRIATSIPVVWPVHPNPNVYDVVVRELQSVANVHLIDPMPYSDMIATLRAARFVITDSGGLQEEAPTFGIPALVVREVTERQEAIEAGASLLVSCDEDRIVGFAQDLADPLSDLHKKMGIPRQLYGDGHAGERIAKDLLEAL